MTYKQTSTLMSWVYAKQHRFIPSIRVTSRRSAKHNSVGKVFKGSRVISEVNINHDYNQGNFRQYE